MPSAIRTIVGSGLVVNAPLGVQGVVDDPTPVQGDRDLLNEDIHLDS